MTIDFTKPVRVKDGREVRILCTDGTHPLYPIIGLVKGHHEPLKWLCGGAFYSPVLPHELDLENYEPKQFVWFNVYEDRNTGELYGYSSWSREHADESAFHAKRVGRNKFKFERRWDE